MKKLLLFLTALFYLKAAQAQYGSAAAADDKKIFLSLGAEIGAPSNTPYGITYGGAATAEVKLINRLGLIITGEYTRYNTKSSLYANLSNLGHPEYIPLKAGLKYYTGPNFYFEGGLGATVYTSTNNGNLFVYKVGFGFNIPVNGQSDIDVGFSYQNFSQSQYQTTGLKVAYRLGW